jgi:uncharacterized protein YdeI (YjbR/CyaY-like superfamily)
MEITETLYMTLREEWRDWLERNHKTEKEVWLVSCRNFSGKPRLAYNDAAEEAICFGWIDGIEKKIDGMASAQRFTPRKLKSNWSELSKERARQMIERGLMTRAGFAKLGNALEAAFQIPDVILKALKADARTWRNFQEFTETYRRVRIGYIEDARNVRLTFKSDLLTS